MNIILIRHGETEDNRKGAVYGQPDGKLSHTGREQARKAALHLKEEAIDIIYTSDLQRCIETARLIAQQHPLLDPIPTSLLREISGGKMSRLPLRLPPRVLSQAVRAALLLNITVPGGESWNSTKTRAKDLLNELYAAHPSATVLLATHNVLIQTIQSLLRQPNTKETRGVTVPNCSVHRFSMSEQLE